MKKILIVEEQIPEISENNHRIMVKKSKTIIKDNKYFNEKFTSKLDAPFKYYLEEWEVLSKQEKRIQLICSNDGGPLRPVHIITELRPKNGVKALFQSEKMLVLKIQNGSFEMTKNSIDERGEIKTNVLKVGDYMSFSDIKTQLDFSFESMVESLERNYEKFINNGYFSPIWSIV